MLPNGVHRGQGPVKFGISPSSDVLSWFGNDYVLEYEKAVGPGDSGGGLICISDVDQKAYLVGIHKKGSISPVFPDRLFSVNVAYYLDWLIKSLR